jgi:drug/metabolite transporter superfamily protein YnfA
LIDDGSVIASAITVEVEWLLIAWYALAADAKRRALFAANGGVFVILALLYLAIRIDVVLGKGDIFDASPS